MPEIHFSQRNQGAPQICQEHVDQQACSQPQQREAFVHGPRTNQQGRNHPQMEEQVVAIPEPAAQEEPVLVSNFQQARAQHQPVEVSIEVPVPTIQKFAVQSFGVLHDDPNWSRVYNFVCKVGVHLADSGEERQTALLGLLRQALACWRLRPATTPSAHPSRGQGVPSRRRNGPSR